MYGADELRMDWRVLAFVLTVSLVGGTLFGVIPVLSVRRDELVHHLKEASRTATAGFSWLRNSLSIAQVASAMVLLVAGLLLTRTLHSLNRVELGFDAAGILTFDINPTNLGYDDARNRSFREQLRLRLASLPGIESFALSSGSPFSSASVRFGLRSSDAPDAPPVEASDYAISPEYFAALGIPLLAGREPGQGDAGTDIVISHSLALRLFGDRNPLGERILGPSFGASTAAPYTVVGIVGDTRVRDLRASEPDLVLYRPLTAVESWRSGTVLVVRSPLPQIQTEAIVREAIAAIEPSLAIWHTATMPESVANTIREERLLARMTVLLAILAGLLAAIGLYSVISYSVAQRTREIGIRMALGARFGAIARLIGREAGVLTVGGIVIGALVAVGVSRILESRLFGVERLDPVSFGAAAALFVVAGLAAAWSPLRVAGRVDPTEALRQE